jgi:hypothetical protein
MRVGADLDQTWNPRLAGLSSNELFRVEIQDRTGVPDVGVFGTILLSRQDASGRWWPWQRISDDSRTVIPEEEQFAHVSAAVVNGELHVCGQKKGGTLVHSSLVYPHDEAPNDRSFRAWEDVEQAASERGSFIDVACAAVDEPGSGGATQALHIVGLTDDGHLWHTIASGWTGGGRDAKFSTWTPFGEIGPQIGEPTREFLAVDATTLPGGGLAIVGITPVPLAKLILTIRTPSGQWSATRDLIADVLPRPRLNMVAAGTCQHGVPPGRWRLAVATVRGAPGISKIQTMFTIISPGKEDWDGDPTTPPTEQAPWKDINPIDPRVGQGLISAITVTERPINDPKDP